ncbi:Uncharacterised protein [uncultured archaeon]|nr:Uncharacterised protein [uncultured archaeon]
MVQTQPPQERGSPAVDAFRGVEQVIGEVRVTRELVREATEGSVKFFTDLAQDAQMPKLLNQARAEEAHIRSLKRRMGISDRELPDVRPVIEIGFSSLDKMLEQRIDDPRERAQVRGEIRKLLRGVPNALTVTLDTDGEAITASSTFDATRRRLFRGYTGKDREISTQPDELTTFATDLALKYPQLALKYPELGEQLGTATTTPLLEIGLACGLTQLGENLRIARETIQKRFPTIEPPTQGGQP